MKLGGNAMKVEYINPIIEASKNVIMSTTGIDPALGKVYIKNMPYKGDKVVVLIGLTGQIKGNVIISMPETLARNIASAMMGGMPVPSFDDLAKSAIAELCNMILGNSAALFQKNNYEIDITPPTLMVGDNIQLSQDKSTTLCIPLIFKDNLVMEIDVSFRE